jgi:hypothetical protein
MQCPGTWHHQGGGTKLAFLERADDGLIDRMAQPEMVGVDDQKPGISRIPKQAVGLARIHE